MWSPKYCPDHCKHFTSLLLPLQLICRSMPPTPSHDALPMSTTPVMATPSMTSLSLGPEADIMEDEHAFFVEKNSKAAKRHSRKKVQPLPCDDKPKGVTR
jgi:hypothetical protein